MKLEGERCDSAREWKGLCGKECQSEGREGEGLG